MIRVGHKGADHVAPGNTRESFQAALEHGVDMIEFDVLRLRDGRLVLAHDLEDAAKREPLTLDEGLDIFAEVAYAGVELDVDMKIPGYEREVVEGLRERGLTAGALISSMHLKSLSRVGDLEPGIQRGWSVPNVRRDYTRSVLAPAALVILQVWRARLPAQAAARLEEAFEGFRVIAPVGVDEKLRDARVGLLPASAAAAEHLVGFARR